MTNNEIIYKEQKRLYEEGLINAAVINGQLEYEPIHTFAYWKELGYRVKKGEKSQIKITIWKMVERRTENQDGEEVIETKTFAKVASFFTLRQVELIK